MTTTEAEHWEVPFVGWLTPESELEDIEIGFRPSWYLLMGDLTHNDFGWVLGLVSQVSQAAQERGVPMPSEWMPSDLEEKENDG